MEKLATVPKPPEVGGNPLVALAVSVIYAILYLLQGVRHTVAIVTIGIPSLVVRMLQYSLTISLTFPTLLTLFAGGAVAVFFLIRYRYLTKYTQLKESALPPPSPPTLGETYLPLPGGPLADPHRHSTNFHNYLDDFLSAIRIFGFLEKPVFHELSRHLQTRRLAAGDTLEIGGGDFWCVVEGKVQVFAPSSDEETSSPPSPDPFSTRGGSSFNGYHLLNEVSTGGTLSSLFSILTLFTEDVKLSWTPEVQEEDDVGHRDLPLPRQGGRNKSRANSDVSQLDFSSMGKSFALDTDSEVSPLTERASESTERADLFDDSDLSSDNLQTPQTNSLASSPPTSVPSSVPSSPPSTSVPSPIVSPSEPTPTRAAASFPSSPRYHDRVFSQTPSLVPNSERSSRPRTKVNTGLGAGSGSLKGTIARATVDTTLAVIPAEAFRKLTKKFPKASGSVVQVVLERFSRVTFMTAHKYLGLTREVLRSEAALNSLVSHPLPREFYSGGGMQALREKLQPGHQTHRSPPSVDASPRVTSKDYFNFVPSSPTVKAPSLPSTTPKNPSTPAANHGHHSFGTMTAINPVKEMPSLGVASSNLFSPDTAARHSSMNVRRTSAMRKQVAAGDLAMTSSTGTSGSAYYRPSAPTPGLPRMDTWRGRLTRSPTYVGQPGGIRADSPEEEEDFEIRKAVLACIAKSIGLSQPASEPEIGQSGAASTTGLSTPNSPLFPPNGRSSSRTPFGNVLDLMNASSPHENIIGGMFREGLIGSSRMEDDMSSVSASVQESSMGADGAKNVLKDLEKHVQILFFKKGSVLVKEGEKAAGLYYVIDGFLEVSIPTHPTGVETPRSSTSINPTSRPPTSSFSNVNGRPFGAALGLDNPGAPEKSTSGRADEPLFTVKPGGIAGYLASLCSTDSYVTITAKTDCFVGFMPHKALERIIERRPIVLLTLAKRLLSLLSPLVLHIDAALDWMQLSAGQALYHKGDRSTDFYVVINGRLRSLQEKKDGVEVLREYGQNDSIGELDVITATDRSDTVHAIRESELVRIPGALFDAISVKHPETTVQFLRLIASRVRRAMGEQSLMTGRMSGPHNHIATDVNLKTVCILGTSRGVPVVQFASRLKQSLEDLGATTSCLDQGTVMSHLGRHAFAQIGRLKVSGWLADQEQHYRTVLYVADTPPSSRWTLTCIGQADLVLIVGMGDDPSLGEYEKLLLATKTTARKELVLLHDERTVAPGSTRPWLKNRPWLHGHHHVEMPGVIQPSKAHPTVHDPAAVTAFKHLREKVETRIKQYRRFRPFARPRRPAHMDDFARIARRLCGKSIGLVLGGGGARGISHIGMLQALEEFGIPVDTIGGCSIGSFVGGLYARETDLLETRGKSKQFAGRMGSVWRILSDVTYPFVSYTTGHEFNRGIYKAFYNTHIEDFWLPFFANSTNITHSRMEVHRSGYAWRYVRASMTLAGLLPPLSDDGNLLVDGGYMDNTPIGPLKAAGVRDIIVVDVGSIDDTSPRNYGDSVSGWWIFINKWNPWFQRSVLSMTEVSSRLTYVSSVKTLEEVKSTPGCLYVAMPVQEFDTLGGFKQFQAVYDVGLAASRECLKKWKDEGILPTGLVDDVKGAKVIQRNNRLRRMSI